MVSIYLVPTGSMKNAIIPGDWILAEKLSFGASLNLTENPYRLPGIGEIEYEDVLVFHFPEGDTVFINNPNQNFYELARCHTHSDSVGKRYNYGKKIMLPINRRIPYVKRCIGLPGDTLMVVEGEVFVNNFLEQKGECVRSLYKLYGDFIEIRKLFYSLKIWNDDFIEKEDQFIIALSINEYDELRKYSCIDSLKASVDSRGLVNLFPFQDNQLPRWTPDNYGPVQIPAKGCSVKFSNENLPFYQRVIRVYEGNSLVWKNDSAFINGQYQESYVFKQNYFFVMGDNRPFSKDSRNWGFVPEDHIIGKAFMVGWSSDPDETGWKAVRWDRIGRIIQ